MRPDDFSGATAPRLGFGCVALGSVSSGQSWRSDVRLVQEAVDRGIRVFDTANSYGNGVSEQILGRALKGRRDKVELATKFGYLFEERSLARQSVMRLARPVITRIRHRGSEPTPDQDSGSNLGYSQQDFSENALRRAVDGSLRRLDTDYIDVLQLHGPQSVLPDIEPVVQSLIASGKVRRFGVGAESVPVAEDWLREGSIDVVQLPFGLLDPQASERAFDLARASSVDVWARGVLAGGVLSGVARGDPAMSSHPKVELVRALQRLAGDSGVDLFQLAIDSVRSFSDVDVVLVGIHSSVHLETNLRMMAQPLMDRSTIEAANVIVREWFAQHGSI